MAFIQGFKKIADAPDSPRIDPRKAAAMQAGALSGGTSMSQAWSNLKSGLGFGSAAPPPAPKNVGVMGRS